MRGRAFQKLAAGAVLLLLTAAFADDAAAAPYLTSLSTTSGPTTGGTAVYLYGGGFSYSGVTRVSFGGADASNVSVYSSGYGGMYIGCTTPTHAAGTVDVTVINPYSGGSATLTGAFTYVVPPPPNPSAISPSSGSSTGGTYVTFTGSDFLTTGTTQVTFGGVSATDVHVYSTGYMSCVTPPHAAGMVDVTIAHANGLSATRTNWYTYTVPPPPSPATVTLNQGYTDGGDVVTIDGGNFSAFVPTQVFFGGVPATNVLAWDAGSGSIRIRCTTPPHPAGAVDVTVSHSDGGTGTLTGTLTAGFTYLTPPTPHATTITPNRGYVQGGTEVVVSGTGFTTLRPPRVTFGGVDAGSITVQDMGGGSMQIHCTTPYHIAGTVDVVVMGPGGLSSALTAAYTYLPPPTPALTSVAPASGPTAGGTNVTVNGSGFSEDGIPSVYFGGVKATNVILYVYSDGTGFITCATPSHAMGAVDVVVVNPDGRAGTLMGGYTYTAGLAPHPTGVSPSFGPTNGGTTATVLGTNFSLTGTTRVTFGGTEATAVAVHNAGYGGTYITCNTPVHAAGAVDVTVINPTGESGTATGAFTYIQATPPNPSFRNPGSGPSTGGTAVNISGTGFSQTGTTRVTFGGVDATGVTVYSSGYGGLHIQCYTPAHVTGTVDMVVINPDGQSATRAGWFAYTAAPPPSPMMVLPPTGSTTGGTRVSVTGSGFTPYGPARVTFGGVDATEVTVKSAGEITCTTPMHAAGMVNVAVVNPDGQTGTLPGGFSYTGPQITTVTPATGPVAGGTPVTIIGSSFAPSGVRVLFDGAEAASPMVSDGEISCILPAHAAGAVDVTVVNPDGVSGTLAGAFTYRASGEIIVRVDRDNTSGVENGTSWATAFRTIQQGVDAVAASGKTGEVWVAEGTYTATAAGTVVVGMAAFCDLYGGFAGVETQRGQRNIETHPAVLDGMDQSPCIYGADNARIDGFTVTRGKGPMRLGSQSSWAPVLAAMGTSAMLEPAVDNSGVSPIMANCTFTNNSAVVVVANLSENSGNSSPLITGCQFTDNAGADVGTVVGNGALAGMMSKPRLDNCEFTGNGYAVQDIAFQGECASTISRCAFRSNYAAYAFAGIYSTTCKPRLENCEFSRCTNRTIYLMGMNSSDLVSPVFTNCTFAGNLGTRQMFYSSTILAQVELRNCIVWGNIGPMLGTDGRVSLTASYCNLPGAYAGPGNINADPRFNGQTFKIRGESPCANTGTAFGAPLTDLRGVARPQFGGVDMGAYECTVKAAYTANHHDVSAPDTPVQFSDASASTLSALTGWSWNFGDASASTLQNPSHTYTAKNTYTVSLDVTGPDDAGSCTGTYHVMDGAPLRIVGQPRGCTIEAGILFTMSVQTQGGFGPLRYQWKKDGQNLTENAQNRTYIIPSLAFDDAGFYTCEVSDDFDTVASLPARLIDPTGVPVSGPVLMVVLAALLAMAGTGRLRRPARRQGECRD